MLQEMQVQQVQQQSDSCTGACAPSGLPFATNPCVANPSRLGLASWQFRVGHLTLGRWWNKSISDILTWGLLSHRILHLFQYLLHRRPCFIGLSASQGSSWSFGPIKKRWMWMSVKLVHPLWILPNREWTEKIHFHQYTYTYTIILRLDTNPYFGAHLVY